MLWAAYDDRVGTLLGMGAASVAESLLRTTARMSEQPVQPAGVDCALMMAKVHHDARNVKALTGSKLPSMGHAGQHAVHLHHQPAQDTDLLSRGHGRDFPSRVLPCSRH